MVTVVIAMALSGAGLAMRRFARQRGAPPPPAEVLPGHEALASLAEELRDALRAERVAVIVADVDRIDGWRVAACIGAPGLLGSRLPVAERRASRTIGAEEAGALGLPRDVCWTYAH